MLDPLVAYVERRRHREDRLAVLDGRHAPGAEGAAVADPVDEVDDLHRRVPRPEEVAVQRVDPECGIDSADRRHERLTGHLTTERPRQQRLRRYAPEDVVLDLFERQDLLDLRHGNSFCAPYARS